MKNAFIGFFLFLFLTSSLAAAYTISDYWKLRYNFEEENKELRQEIRIESNLYITALKHYKECAPKSKWRVYFKGFISRVSSRNLDRYKQRALMKFSDLNSEWLKTAQEHNIRQISAGEDISGFYLWSQNQIVLLKEGPLHELKIYVVELSKLTNSYERMAQACEGNPKALGNYHLIVEGIEALLDSFPLVE